MVFLIKKQKKKAGQREWGEGPLWQRSAVTVLTSFQLPSCWLVCGLRYSSMQRVLSFFFFFLSQICSFFHPVVLHLSTDGGLWNCWWAGIEIQIRFANPFVKDGTSLRWTLTEEKSLLTLSSHIWDCDALSWLHQHTPTTCSQWRVKVKVRLPRCERGQSWTGSGKISRLWWSQHRRWNFPL